MESAAAKFLSNERIAVIGVSRSRGFGNSVMRTLEDRGYKVYPINANAETIEGRPCYRSLAMLPESVDAVVAVVPPQQTLNVVDDCIRLGIKHLWMQQGSESKEAIERALNAGVGVIHHSCILMYAQPAGIHKLHRWLHDSFIPKNDSR
jgi:predicted CoA-binding protein